MPSRAFPRPRPRRFSTPPARRGAAPRPKRASFRQRQLCNGCDALLKLTARGADQPVRLRLVHHRHGRGAEGAPAVRCAPAPRCGQRAAGLTNVGCMAHTDATPPPARPQRKSVVKITTGSTSVDEVLGGGVESQASPSTRHRCPPAAALTCVCAAQSITELYGEFRCAAPAASPDQRRETDASAQHRQDAVVPHAVRDDADAVRAGWRRGQGRLHRHGGHFSPRAHQGYRCAPFSASSASFLLTDGLLLARRIAAERFNLDAEAVLGNVRAALRCELVAAVPASVA